MEIVNGTQKNQEEKSFYSLRRVQKIDAVAVKVSPKLTLWKSLRNFTFIQNIYVFISIFLHKNALSEATYKEHDKLGDLKIWFIIRQWQRIN